MAVINIPMSEAFKTDILLFIPEEKLKLIPGKIKTPKSDYYNYNIITEKDIDKYISLIDFMYQKLIRRIKSL